VDLGGGSELCAWVWGGGMNDCCCEVMVLFLLSRILLVPYWRDRVG
jgi:hypothetical protein